MSIVVILSSQVKPEKLNALLPFLEENLPNVRGFKGCQNVTVLLNQETGEMVFNETWKDQPAHANYIQFIQENGVMEQLVSYLKGPPTVSYLDTLDI